MATNPQSSAPHTPSFQAPVALDSYLQNSQSTNSISQSNAPTSVPRSQAPQGQQYTFQPPTSSPAELGPPMKFIDNNPRPAKSPRHAAVPDRQAVATEAPYPEYSSRYAAPYIGSGGDAMPPRDPGYFPAPLQIQQQQSQPQQQQSQHHHQQQQTQHSQQPQQSWSSNPDTSGVYGTAMQAPVSSLNQHYQFPSEPYVKEETSHHQNYTWNPS